MTLATKNLVSKAARFKDMRVLHSQWRRQHRPGDQSLILIFREWMSVLGGGYGSRLDMWCFQCLFLLRFWFRTLNWTVCEPMINIEVTAILVRLIQGHQQAVVLVQSLENMVTSAWNRFKKFIHCVLLVACLATSNDHHLWIFCLNRFKGWIKTYVLTVWELMEDSANNMKLWVPCSL
jgi:hypothetical protein